MRTSVMILSLLMVGSTLGCDDGGVPSQGLGAGGGDGVICDPEDDPTPPLRLRDPLRGQCQDVASEVGVTPCGGDAPDVTTLPDWGNCTTSCDTLGEQACEATSGCRPIYAVGGGLSLFTACWATAPSGPVRGDGCAGLDAQECSRHDDCVAEHQGLETCDEDGTCVRVLGDFQSCREPIDLGEAVDDGGCSAPRTAAACAEVPGCEPVYDQTSCLCDGTSCSCYVWSFLSCRRGW